MKLDLESKKVEDLDPPAPTYQEDQTLQPGVEVQKSAGTMGSRWETYKVIYKDGKEVSRETGPQDHIQRACSRYPAQHHRRGACT